MDNSISAPYKNRAEILDMLCALRGSSRYNDLEAKADEAIRNVCGRRGIKDSDDLIRVLRYVSHNGFDYGEKPLIRELINKRFSRRY